MVQKLAAAVLAALLVAVGYGWWATNQATTPVRALKAKPGAVGPASGALPVIDESTLLTAQRLARRADTAEEQPLAQAAVQTANHELDLAFAAALRHLETHPPPLSPEATRIQQRLLEAQKAVANDTETLKRLNVELARASDAEKPGIQDRIELTQSQLELEQDEVQEANDDLLRAGGNVHQRLQMLQEEHQAAARAAPPPPPTASALGTLKGMVGEARQWWSLHRKQNWLEVARQHALDSAAQLAAERAQIAAELEANKALVPQFTSRGSHPTAAATTATTAAASTAAATAPPPAVAAPPAAAAAATQAPASGGAASAPPTTLLELTRRIASEQRRLTLREQRISARHKLADIYGEWQSVVATQARTVLHAGLAGAAVVLAALLLLLFADRWLERLLGRAPIDRRQLATVRSVVGVALQIVGVLVILLVLVGVPGQFATMVGIVGAGLTVALKDFIVAFIGWFVLMGRNGIRLGDWVEINGVSGEVVELNMFHTVLLETGNWTDTGHPTGRRVTFTNSFAIGGHYFNFSTSGQWLWDELTVVVPYERDPHAFADAMLREVSAVTAKDASQAEQEWQRASRGQRGVKFSTQPGIEVRPATGGAEVAVRYVTRASERLTVRAKLYQTAVQLLAAHA